MTASRRLTDVQYALKAKALAQLAREIGIAEAVAVIKAAKEVPEDETATPRELAAELAGAKRDEMMAELIRQEKEGRRRGAVRRVARDYALDRHDPIEVETNERNLRRWRKKNLRTMSESCPRNRLEINDGNEKHRNYPRSDNR
jgi:hypothetical protein